MGLFAYRVLSFAVSALGWALAGVRWVLDLIGYSTAPDDATVAKGLLEQFLVWLMSLPWWLPWGFALTATMWLMWVSWPKSVVANPSLASQPTSYNIENQGDKETKLLDEEKAFSLKKNAASEVPFYKRVSVGLIQINRTKLESERVIQIIFRCFNGNDHELLVETLKGGVKMALPDGGNIKKPFTLPVPALIKCDQGSIKKSLSNFRVEVEQRLEQETVDRLLSLGDGESARLYFDGLSACMSKRGSRDQWAPLPVPMCVKIAPFDGNVFHVAPVTLAKAGSAVDNGGSSKG